MADPAPQNSAASDVTVAVAVDEADPDVGPVGVPLDVAGEGVPLGPEHDATADIARTSTSADPNAVSRLLGWNISVSFHNRLLKGGPGQWERVFMPHRPRSNISQLCSGRHGKRTDGAQTRCGEWGSLGHPRGGPAASGVESPEPRAPGALPPSAPSNAGPGGPAGLFQAADVFLC
ncbi:hypothetical protein GCM10023346_40240 [Arthrobacter gyeryongensis]|uniref:Uncharacterized protein n=1 Tax=Arthrobacter gyeryongensis TaxID=1650592 RepID=A0ABP9SPV5_9MICC